MLILKAKLTYFVRGKNWISGQPRGTYHRSKLSSTLWNLFLQKFSSFTPSSPPARWHTHTKVLPKTLEKHVVTFIAGVSQDLLDLCIGGICAQSTKDVTDLAQGDLRFTRSVKQEKCLLEFCKKQEAFRCFILPQTIKLTLSSPRIQFKLSSVLQL